MPVSLGMVDHTLPVPAAEIDRKTMVSTPLDDTDAEDIAVHSLPTIRRIAAEDILLTHEEEGTIVLPIRTMLLLTLDDALALNSLYPSKTMPRSTMDELAWDAASTARLNTKWANAALLSARDSADAANAISKNTRGDVDSALAAQLAAKK